MDEVKLKGGSVKNNNAIEETVLDHQDISLVDYDRLVLSLHDGSYDDTAMTAALDRMRKQFQANFVTLILRIPGVEDIGLMLVSGNLAVHGQLAYVSYYRNLTPFSGQAVDQVFTQRDVMTDEQWVATDYYQSSCKHQNVFHVMGADISTEQDGVFRLRITRPQASSAFDEKDRALCQMLLPHIRRALHVRTLLGRSESMGNLYADAINRLSVATILLNDKGHVQKLNDYAQALLDKSDGLKLVGDRLEASYPSDNKELQRRIKEAFDAHGRGESIAKEPLSVTRPSGEVNLGIVFEAIPDTSWLGDKDRGTLLLYVRDAVNKSTVSSTVAKELFDFTPAETALALELANGFSLEDAAEKLGIMRNTARAHLRAIFSKTGVRRQAELVRVMLNSVVALSGTVVGPTDAATTLVPGELLIPLRRDE